MTLSYTARFKLAVPDFLSEPWHSEFAQSMESIDQALYNVLIAMNVTLWANSIGYVVGAMIINPDNGAVFVCSTQHTSTASPQTFTQELIDNPTYWTVLAPTLATQAEAEAGADNTKYMSPLRTKQALSTLASQTSPVVPNSGILYANSSTLLGFTPWNGNKIKINGNLFDIPNSGIAGLGNTGVFVSTNPGQNLAASTAYLVTAFDNAGVVTANYNAVVAGMTHRPSQTPGNEGVEVLYDGTEFPNYTLIGIVMTDAGGQFIDVSWQRLVRSWFNRAGTPMQTWLTASQTTTSDTYSEISPGFRMEWVNFANETVRLSLNCPFYAASATGIHASIGIDNSTPQNTWGSCGSSSALTTGMISIDLLATLPVGDHFGTPLYHTTGGVLVTAAVLADAAGSRPTFRGMIHPYEGMTAVQ